MTKNIKTEIKSNRIIKEATKYKLWAVSAGRCSLCNQIVYLDSTFGINGNYGELAHIHAVGVSGPRHVSEMSTEELNCTDNLVLLCQEHHKMIDDSPDIFPGDFLKTTKSKHEDRIRQVTEISNLTSCRMVSYCTTIDNNEIPVHEKEMKRALIGEHLVPDQDKCINLASGFHCNDRTKSRYEAKSDDLVAAFHQKIESITTPKECIGIFALAPIPLLIKFGTLINDQYKTKVFQRHRTGAEWAWVVNEDFVDYQVYGIDNFAEDTNVVAINVSLSASINNERIESIIGSDIPIVTITIEDPKRDFVTNENISNRFVSSYRSMIEQIKYIYSPMKILLFPAMPASLAVRLGQDFMFKTDPVMTIYDEDNSRFIETITIGGNQQ